MPNDLRSDLSRLVARIEREDAPLAAADPYRPYFHLAPPVGWMGMPDAPYSNPATVACGWQHCLTVPCELTQRGGRLHRYPVKELEQLREKPVSPENAHIFDMELRIFTPEGLSYAEPLW